MRRRALILYNLSLLITLMFIFILANPIGSLPPLGSLLNPFHGFWRNGPMKMPERETLRGLDKTVEVVWDSYRIPHIFALTQRDLFFAQGYVEARDRLFQMDLMTRAGVGRLADLVGPKALETDQFFVKLGFRTIAQRTLDFIKKDPESWEALDAYSQGVNFYIQSLDKKDWPLEYKLLGVGPSAWDPERSVALLNIMSFNLAGRSYDLHLTKHLKAHGLEKVKNLFPEFLPSRADDFVILKNDFEASQKVPTPSDSFVTAFDDFPEFLQPFASNGSNNWAVGPKKSQTGATILANDTHLAYSLPGVWYELQLIAPGINVYGSSFPGAPLVIVGFTQSVGWAVTNGTTDVLDWYEVEFRDEQSLEYLFEEQWHLAERQVETIEVQRGKSVEVEVLWTRSGVVMHREESLGLAAQWVVHEPSNEIKTFLELNKAKNFVDCNQALSFYQAPAQNFICADAKNIGLWHTGLLPKRWSQQGRFVLNGRLDSHQWQGWIPREQNPSVENPPEGFVRSANQRVVDESYPYYLGWDYEESYRGRRIRQALEEKEKWSLEDMIQLQNDELNLHAAEVLPHLLDLVEDQILRLQETDDKTQEGPGSVEMWRSLLKSLQAWDFVDRADSWVSSVFHLWWDEFELAFWEPNLGPREGGLYPKRQRSSILLHNISAFKDHPDHLWIPEGKSLEDLAWDGLVGAWDILTKEFGNFVESPPETWKWGRVQGAGMPHLLGVSGLGEPHYLMGGSQYAVNANRGSHGATWRMIVAFGEGDKDTEGWVNFPGGPSGNPFDPSYEQFTKSWSQGELRKVVFLKEQDGSMSLPAQED